MNKIGIIFIVLLLLSSCMGESNNKENITIDTDTIKISDIDNQPNF